MQSGTSRTAVRSAGGPLLPLLLATGCGNAEPGMMFCTAPKSLAIEVTVTDSISGNPLADSTTGSLQLGSVVDSLQHTSPTSPVLYGGDQLGSYDVTVTRPGYALWTQRRVAVKHEGPCGNVLPVALAARMQPGP